MGKERTGKQGSPSEKKDKKRSKDRFSFEATPLQSRSVSLSSSELSNDSQINKVDLYADLRYHEPLQSARESFDEPEWRSKFVSVERRFTPCPPVQDFSDRQKCQDRLQLGSFPEQSLQVLSERTSILRTTACFSRAKENKSQVIYRERLETVQVKALKHWQKAVAYNLKEEADLSQRLGRTADKHVLYRCTMRPILQPRMSKGDARGIEYDWPQRTQCERFYQGPAFFKIAERYGRDELPLSLTWKERRLYKPPCFVIPQRPDDPPPPASPPKTGPFQGLFIRGQTVPKDDSSFNTGDAGDHEGTSLDLYDTPQKAKSLRGVAFARRCTVKSLSLTLPCADSLQQEMPSETVQIKYEKPCLMVNDHIFAWDEPCFDGIIELGTVCKSGERAQVDIKVTNIGSTVMYFHMFKEKHDDHVGQGRCCYDSPLHVIRREGTLLPDEETSVPIRFLPEYPGKWRELWYMITQPIVGPKNKPGISFSVFGFATESSPSQMAHIKMQKDLDSAATMRMISHMLDDLVRWLPVHGIDVYERYEKNRAWIQRLQPDVLNDFKKKNPRMTYHSVEVADMLDVQKRLQLIQDGKETQLGSADLHKRRGVKGKAGHLHKALSEEDNRRGSRPVTQTGSNDTCDPYDNRVHSGKSEGQAQSGKGDCTSASNVKSDSRVQSAKGNGRVQSAKSDGRTQTSRSPSRATASKISYNVGGPLSVEDQLLLMTQKANMDLAELRREILALDDYVQSKDMLMGRVNCAIVALEEQRSKPITHTTKHLRCRLALANTLDLISLGEWRLRKNLRAENDPEAELRATFPFFTPALEEKSTEQGESRSGGAASPSPTQSMEKVMSKALSPDQSFFEDEEDDEEYEDDDSAKLAPYVSVLNDPVFLANYSQKLYALAFAYLGDFAQSVDEILSLEQMPLSVHIYKSLKT